MLTTRDLNDIQWALKDLVFRLQANEQKFFLEIDLYKGLEDKLAKISRELAYQESLGHGHAQLAIRLEMQPPSAIYTAQEAGVQK